MVVFCGPRELVTIQSGRGPNRKRILCVPSTARSRNPTRSDGDVVFRSAPVPMRDWNIRLFRAISRRPESVFFSHTSHTICGTFGVEKSPPKSNCSSNREFRRTEKPVLLSVLRYGRYEMIRLPEHAEHFFQDPRSRTPQTGFRLYTTTRVEIVLKTRTINKKNTGKHSVHDVSVSATQL